MGNGDASEVVVDFCFEGVRAGDCFGVLLADGGGPHGGGVVGDGDAKIFVLVDDG